MNDRHLPGLSLLDALRPPPGWRVDRALLSTYSAEPAAIAAALLALAARDDEQGSGTKVGLARALIELRGRVAIILQRGRFAVPRRGGMVVRILDRYVREVPWNEGRSEEGEGQSWHAKCALVRMKAEAREEIAWRFHLGSRNLTRDMSWDIGLRIDSRSGADRGQSVPGLVGVAERLAQVAGETEAWAPLLVALKDVRWDVPRGLTIRDIRLFLPADRSRRFLAEPDGVSKIVAVSPFLDGTAVGALGKWGTSDAVRQLCSTRPSLAPIALQSGRPLKAYSSLVTLPATTEAQEVSDIQEQDSSDAAIDENRGLHAKFIWAEHHGGATLWLGSANLTSRGWMRNGEIVGEVGVERRGNASAAIDLGEGVYAFRDCGEEVKEEDLAKEVPEVDSIRQRLDEARRQVSAALAGYQSIGSDNAITVACETTPHPDDPAVGLFIGPLGGQLKEWPRECASVALAESTTAPSNLLIIELRQEDEVAAWTQFIPFSPPLTADRLDERDVTLLGNWLGVGRMMAAIRDLLDGTGDDDSLSGEKWDSEETSSPLERSRAASDKSRMPSLEQVLKAWMRDPQRLNVVEQLLNAIPTLKAGPGEEAEKQLLEEFLRTWVVLRHSLNGQTHGG